MKRILAVAPVFLLLSCATVALSPEGERVRMVNDNASVAGCTLVGTVDASTSEAEAAYNTLRNKAAAIGADTILVPRNRLGIADPPTSAPAYRCAK
jgi:hypothetical protein